MIKTIKTIKLPLYFVIQKFFGSLFGITIVNDNKESIFWNTIEIGDKNNKKPLFENVDDIMLLYLEIYFDFGFFFLFSEKIIISNFSNMNNFESGNRRFSNSVTFSS